MGDTRRSETELPQVGAPFAPGDRVAFFPVEIGPSSLSLSVDYAIIEEIRPGDGFAFHFEGEPDKQYTQGLENVVRTTENYFAWRAAIEEAYARLGSIDAADAETEELRRRVVAEYPIDGPDVHARATRSS